jgi:hypothetical protein
MTGAATNPTDWMLATTPSQRACFDKGNRWRSILTAPIPIALEPRPAIERPRTNIFELVANVHRSEPNSKTIIPKMKTDLMEKMV